MKRKRNTKKSVAKKKSEYPRALTRVTIMLTSMGLLIWLAGMICLTSITAEYEASRFIGGYSSHAYTIANYAMGNFERNIALYDGEEFNYKKKMFWDIVGVDNIFYSCVSASGNSLFIPYREMSEMSEVWGVEKIYSATAIYDVNGNCVEDSGNDFFFFEYLTQWDTESKSSKYARAIFDREKLTEEGQKLLIEAENWPRLDVRAMRFTGSFDGTELVPVQIDYVNTEILIEGRNKLVTSSAYSDDYMIERYDLWVPIYENPDVVVDGAEFVTLYTKQDMADLCWEEQSPAFVYGEKAYEDLNALVHDIATEIAETSIPYGYESQYTGLGLVIPSAYSLLTEDGEVSHYVVSAIYCNPWYTAVCSLWTIYLVTFFAAAVLIFLVWLSIKKQLIEPARVVSDAMLNEKFTLERNPKSNWKWQEGKDLEQVFMADKIRRRKKEDEITRLNTALDYAKDAEQNRRQMTSNIAHELKTPLAIIHSYAEGLKENIAENKREKYLNVIMSESERMDNMVLEMLDLSRLEAGRVKLNRSEVDLGELTHEIFDKLGMAIEAKELKLQYRVPKDLDGKVMADKVRIAQVIENFATNAVKYTPYGGNICVKMDRKAENVTFAMENDCEQMTPQEILKVWDTFYRTDESRSSSGTGLGLAIAKNIIELHGGKCGVRNTPNGVEFNFTI